VGLNTERFKLDEAQMRECLWALYDLIQDGLIEFVEAPHRYRKLLGQANLSNSEVIERLREFGVPEHQISDLDDDQHSAQTLTGIENRVVSEIALSDVVCLIKDVLDGLHVDDTILLNLLMSQSRSAASNCRGYLGRSCGSRHHNRSQG